MVEAAASVSYLNPARNLGTALVADNYHSLWPCWVALHGLRSWPQSCFYHGEDLDCAVSSDCVPRIYSPHLPGEEPPQYPDMQTIKQ
jgi:hypothetical protein